MSSGTRSQNALAHERFRRRAEIFKPVIQQAEALSQVSLQALNDFPADSQFDANDVSEMVLNLVPGLDDILCDKFMSCNLPNRYFMGSDEFLRLPGNACLRG